MEVGSEAVGHAVLRSPPLQGGRIQSFRTHGAPEPSLVGRRGLEPWYTWRRRSPSIREAGSGATEHVAAPEATLAGRKGPVLQGTW
jgi:hypothetical protein